MASLIPSSLIRFGGLLALILSLNGAAGSFCSRSFCSKRDVQVITDDSRPDPHTHYYHGFLTCNCGREPLKDTKGGELEDARSQVMQATMGVQGLMGWFMKGLMRRNMGKLLSEALEELKHFVETGTPHPRKQAAMQAFAAA